MAEITSDVFDIFHPTPAPLRELSVIVISLEIWRCEINKYRSSNTLKEFRPAGELISLKTILIPHLPSVIYSTIEKYVERFGLSMNNWLRRHHLSVFHFHYDHKNSVLEYFEDFVCDYDGTIHYGRTAERMMHCDRFDTDQKFLIACGYCFKDDVVRIYPFIEKKMIMPYDNFFKYSQLVYWIFFAGKNVNLSRPDIIDVLFDYIFRNGPSLEYFWNLIPLENRLEKAIDIFNCDLPSFVRFILPKLDGQQLNEFLYDNGCALLYALLKKSCYYEEVILSTWIYVENAMNEIAFTELVEKIMKCEFAGVCVSCELDQDEYKLDEDDHVDDDRDLGHFLQLCFEIWNTAAENLKRSAVRRIT
ncbi:uncharacterized protein LOC135848803 [Planococcus citri]|uniref:uncharacterized protein LOC135848803 n=1 Tax=Planococcus citri TaxID=170843 RepID=UPI0031F7B553